MTPSGAPGRIGFYLDENLSRRLALLARARGLDVTSAQEADVGRTIVLYAVPLTPCSARRALAVGSGKGAAVERPTPFRHCLESASEEDSNGGVIAVEAGVSSRLRCGLRPRVPDPGADAHRDLQPRTRAARPRRRYGLLDLAARRPARPCLHPLARRCARHRRGAAHRHPARLWLQPLPAGLQLRAEGRPLFDRRRRQRPRRRAALRGRDAAGDIF